MIAEHRLYYLMELADRIVYLEKEKSKEYTPRKNFGSYLNLIVNTWGCELLIYRRYSRKKPTCLRLPLYWSCGM